MADYDLPDEWLSQEAMLFLDLIGTDPNGVGDEHLRGLFDMAMFDPNISPEQRQDAYEALVDYLWTEYGIDFEDTFDWQDYKEWYESQT